MKLKNLLRSHHIIIYLLCTLMVPNMLLIHTEQQTCLMALCNILLPLGIYTLLTSILKNVGKTIWMMFPFIFLSAFQIVLTFLFGRSIIGVDMYLNLITTNANEVGEMLDGILVAVITVFVLYLPVLIVGVIAIRKRWNVTATWLRKQRFAGLAIALLGMVAWGVSLISGPRVALADDIFPANVIYNFGLSIERLNKTSHYHETSDSFSFKAKRCEDSGAGRSIIVFVLGETARADHFSLMGYERNTCPELSSIHGLQVFPHAMSESNTTHKSVPMLLSSVDASTFENIYSQKSIITAFREAGYKTAFISNQLPNRSFIEFFGQEADTTLFIRDLHAQSANVYDAELSSYAKSFIDSNKDSDIFIVLHCYGSHFNYTDRYPQAFSRFKPDNIPAATSEHRANLINAYDNSILYTDHFVASLTKTLSLYDADAILLYTSDHGEDLYDDGKHFMHASPIPSVHQLHVPLMIWTSPAYQSTHEETLQTLHSNADKAISTSITIFHTLLHLASIQTPWFKADASLASPSYHEREPMYITDRNEAVRLSELLGE